MGQYYKPVSLDSEEWIYSHEYDSGLKLMEHSWRPNPFVNAVVNLLAPGGEWYKDKIVWAGDYGDDGLFLDNREPKSYIAEHNDEEYEYNLYGYADDYFEKIKPAPGNYNPELRYLCNHDLGEFVDLEECPDIDGWIVHPLPLLTSNGNGRGGGDYRHHHGEEYVGSWAGNHISMECDYPDGYEEIYPDFKED